MTSQIWAREIYRKKRDETARRCSLAQTIMPLPNIEYERPPITQYTEDYSHVSNANTTIGRGVWGLTPVVIKKINHPTAKLTIAQYEHVVDELCVLHAISSFDGERHNCLPCLSVFMINGRIHLVFPLCICDFRIFYYQDWRFCDTIAPLIVKFIMEIVNALQFLHAHGISHRDIKANNVLLCYKNGKFSAKLTDYGSSTFEKKTTRLDGTRQYMAPEVSPIIKHGERKQHSHNCSVDYWSLGVLIHVIITNRLPFRDENDISTRVFREWTEWLHTPGAMYMPRISIFYKDGDSSYECKNGINLPKIQIPDAGCKLLLAGMDGFMTPQPTHRLNGEGFKELACGLVQDDTAIAHELFLEFVLSLPSDAVIGRNLLL